MKKIVIIDGYNAIQRTKKFAKALDASLEAARDLFARHIKNYCANRHTFDDVIIVFDGAKNKDSDCRSNRYQDGQVTIVFSSFEESADDLIKSLARENKGSSRVTVVSDDNYVINNTRAWGADIMSCADFTDLISFKGGKKRDIECDDKDLNNKDIASINEQLRNEWKL